MKLYLIRLSLALISLLDQLLRICQVERILEHFRTRVRNHSLSEKCPSYVTSMSVYVLQPVFHSSDTVLAVQ